MVESHRCNTEKKKSGTKESTLYDLIFVKSYNGQNKSMDQVGGQWPHYWGELRKEATGVLPFVQIHRAHFIPQHPGG